MARKTYQYRLTEVECQLHNLLRRLEAEFENEFPKIFNGADVSKLDKALTLSVGFGGRELESFNLTGTQLIQDCASAGAKVVRKLLTSDELDLDYSESPNAGDAPLVTGIENRDRAMSGLTREKPPAITNNEVTSWESIKKTVIPPYVKSVSFTVARNDLNPSREEELESRFPGVKICTDPLSVNATDDLTDKLTCESQFAADQFLRQISAVREPVVSPANTTACLPSLDTRIQTVAETIPAAPLSAATPKRSLLSRMSVDPSATRIGSVGTSNTDDLESHSGHRKTQNESPILRIAEPIGLKISAPRDKVIHAMWLQWQNQHEVRPYATRRLTLEQYYDNLVTLYILAHHKKEFDLCFAVLVRFQNTNYWSTEKFPNVSTAVLAYQYLPEDNDLCCWIALLFSFLWGTQQFQSYKDLLVHHDSLDRDALSKLLFSIAHMRCPFTKGNDAAVLDRWCDVHHHKEGSQEEALCREMYDTMKADPDQIRDTENMWRRQEAEDTLEELERIEQSKPLGVGLPPSTPFTKGKRKAESPATHSHKNKFKRGGGRGGGRGGFGRGSS